MHAASQKSIHLRGLLGFHRHNIRRVSVVFKERQAACSVEVVCLRNRRQTENVDVQ